jgi:GT2 family glycosyltransferase
MSDIASPRSISIADPTELQARDADCSHPWMRASGVPKQPGYDLKVPPISVVIPTCGRPALLHRCIEALAGQRFVSCFEVIVVDDRPSPQTRAVVEQWAAKASARAVSIRYIASHGPHGPAAARNKGWRAARADIVAFTDDDTVPDPDWLCCGLRAFDADVEAVWGRIVMPVTGIPTDYELDAQGLERAEFATANCFCSKRVLSTLNGFDERFRLAWREDADLYFRLLRCHARVVQAPEAVVVHPVRAAGWGVSLKQQKKILFDALLFKKHRDLYRQKIRATPRWDYYAVVLALACWVLGPAMDSPFMATAGAVIWLALTAQLCGKRLSGTSRSPGHVLEMIITSAAIPPLAVFWRLVGAARFRVAFL